MRSTIKMGTALGATLLLLTACSTPAPSGTAYFSQAGEAGDVLNGRSHRHETSGARSTAMPVVVSDTTSDQAEDSDLPAGVNESVDGARTDNPSTGDPAGDEPSMDDPSEDDPLAGEPSDLEGPDHHEDEPSEDAGEEPVGDGNADEDGAGSRAEPSDEGAANPDAPEAPI